MIINFLNRITRIFGWYLSQDFQIHAWEKDVFVQWTTGFTSLKDAERDLLRTLNEHKLLFKNDGRKLLNPNGVYRIQRRISLIRYSHDDTP